MAYNKGQVEALGDALLDAVDAVRDGVGVDDTAAAIALFTALAGAADEIKGDTDAALLHLVGHMASKVGDRRVDALPSA